MKYDVSAKQLELSTLLDFKADVVDLLEWLADDLIRLPEKPNTYTHVEDRELYWIGPDHWLLRASVDQESKLIEQLSLNQTPENISAVIVSDALTFFSLTGSEAEQVVSILSPLDIHPTVFTENAVSYTEAFGLKALLIRRQDGFEFAVDRSYTDMFKDVLTRAGANID